MRLGDALDEDVAIAAITASALLHGVHRLKGGVKQAKAERFVERLLDRIPVIAFDLEAARVHARLGAELAAKGAASLASRASRCTAGETTTTYT